MIPAAPRPTARRASSSPPVRGSTRQKGLSRPSDSSAAAKHALVRRSIGAGLGEREHDGTGVNDVECRAELIGREARAVRIGAPHVGMAIEYADTTKSFVQGREPRLEQPVGGDSARRCPGSPSRYPAARHGYATPVEVRTCTVVWTGRSSETVTRQLCSAFATTWRAASSCSASVWSLTT